MFQTQRKHHFDLRAEIHEFMKRINNQNKDALQFELLQKNS